MSTQTGSQIYPRNNAVRANHSGVQMAAGTITSAVTATAASVFLLCRVPHGATIVDFMFFADDAAADQTYTLGLVIPEGSTSGSATLTASALLGDTSLSTVTLPFRGTLAKLPYSVDIGDAASPQWAWVCAVNAVATSASASLKIIVWYTMADTTP